MGNSEQEVLIGQVRWLLPVKDEERTTVMKITGFGPQHTNRRVYGIVLDIDTNKLSRAAEGSASYIVFSDNLGNCLTAEEQEELEGGCIQKIRGVFGCEAPRGFPAVY